MKHVLFAERVGPMLLQAETTAAASVAGLTGEAYVEAARAKARAAKAVPALRAILYPEDDDG